MEISQMVTKKRDAMLVDSEWVLENLQTPNLVILESCYEEDDVHSTTVSSTYIPGAISVHPSYFECGLDKSKYYPQYKCPADGNLLSGEHLHTAIMNLGIDAKTVVMVYGKGDVPMMSSCRVAWSLMYAGVEDVRLLNGGFPAWVRFGGSMSDVPNALEPKTDFWGSCKTQYLAETTDIKDGAGVLVDIRRWREFSGTYDDTYSFFKQSGHIPKAIWGGNWDEYLDENGLLISLDTVRQKWATLGIGAENSDTLIFYCGTGWRSCVGFVLAHRMGYNAKNYDDSFYGWSAKGNEIHKT